MNNVMIGVDLGGTNIKAAAVSKDGNILGKASRPTQAEKGLNGVLNNIDETVQTVLRKANISFSEVCAAGIGAPGPMNWQTGVVYSPPNLPGWKNVPLAELLQKKWGIPCFVDNDANVACYGEFWLGAGKDVKNMVLLTLGTGVGGGLIIMGKLLRGPDGTAGEIGHLCVERDGRACNCGAKGCLETYASVTGMVRTAVEGIQKGARTLLIEMTKGDLHKIDGKMISDAATKGDEFAKWVIQETGIWLGIAIGSLINLLNPEKIVLSGGMIGAGEILFDSVRETAKRQSFEVPGNRAHIVPAALDPDSGVIGAAGCALERLFEKPSY